jgi:hypothetical protein
MRSKTIPLITLTFAFLFYTISLITQGFNFLSTNIVAAIIFSLSIFLLPALISRVLLRKKYFGLGYLVGLLIYPLIYIVGYLLSTELNIDINLTYRISSLVVMFSTMYLFLVNIYESNIHESKRISKAILGTLIVIGLTLGVRYLLNLENDSALSLDFLQHNTVAQQISDGKLCLTPNDCSSLFKKLGYTSFFHTVQTVLTVGFNLEIGIAETSFNIGFIAISTLAIFSFFQKHFKDDETSFIAALIAISVFELGAYSFNFMIPQTFTLLIFINILSEKRLKWSEFLLAIPLLLISHFIFGPFFAGILVIYQIFFNNDLNKKSRGLAKTVALILFLGVIVTFVANLRGFSVEKVIQKEDIEQLGFYTNLYYPQNLIFIAKQYGPLLIPFIFASIYNLLSKKSSNISLFSVSYVSICLMAYFVGPTYANKFLIGSSVFMMLGIVSFLNSIDFRRWFKLLLLAMILISMIPLYLLNFSRYTTFYTQNTGKISSLVKDDNELIDFLQENSVNCQIVSDPYTQLIIASQTTYDTAGGQYQELNSRESFMNLLEEPNEENYERLLTSTDIEEPFCILLSSRSFSRKMYVNESNIPWINSMYEYEINNSYGIGEISDIIEFLGVKGFTTYYTDRNFRLFIPQNTE